MFTVACSNSVDEPAASSAAGKQEAQLPETAEVAEAPDRKIENEGKETLSQYSTEQIEYARIWLRLGQNQELDELNVRHIAAGEPVNRESITVLTITKSLSYN